MHTIGFTIGSTKDRKDIVDKETQPGSAEKCQSRCKNSAKCRLFAYIIDSNECLMKTFKVSEALVHLKIVSDTGHLSVGNFCKNEGYLNIQYTISILSVSCFQRLEQ